MKLMVWDHKKRDWIEIFEGTMQQVALITVWMNHSYKFRWHQRYVDGGITRIMMSEEASVEDLAKIIKDPEAMLREVESDTEMHPRLKKDVVALIERYMRGRERW